MAQEQWRRLGNRVLTYALLAGIGIVMLLPLLWLVGTAFKAPTEDIFQYPPRFLPQQPTFENFVKAWNSAPFGNYVVNSLMVSSLTVALNLLSSSLAAYPLSRLSFKGREVIFTAIVATIGDARQFKTGRDLAAWLGLTPLNKSSGGKERLGRITKKGDQYIRKLLIVGMTSRALMAKNKPEKADIWTAKMLAEKPFRLATVAMANKSARIIWALLTKREEYRQPIV